jgi:hypothetical protein
VPIVAAIAALLLGVVFFTLVMLPLSIVMRFRAGSMRRRAWGWMTSLNLFAAALSATLLLVTAAISNSWIPNAFLYTLTGVAAGFALGFLGLALSRWETTPQGVHYTPNRWLILTLTVIVTSRILYGFWRAWNAWQTTPNGESWLAASGAAGSMAAGAVVLGYYVVYWAGLQRRVRKHRGLWQSSRSYVRLPPER